MSIRDLMLKFLNLQGYKSGGLECRGKEILIRVELRRRAGNCAHRGKRSGYLPKYQKERIVWPEFKGQGQMNTVLSPYIIFCYQNQPFRIRRAPLSYLFSPALV